VANLIRRDLAPIRWAVCASPGYLKAFAAPDDANDLRRHNCIFYASAVVRGDVWTLSRKGETRLITVSGNFRANNSEAVREPRITSGTASLRPRSGHWSTSRQNVSGALPPGTAVSRWVLPKKKR
jgi:DNA-binding transcriptional LysR family regulator